MQLTLTILAAVLGLATLALLWRLWATVATLCEDVRYLAALVDDDDGWEDDYDEPEPDGVQVAGPADCNDYRFEPVALYDGQGWRTRGTDGH